MCSNAGRTRSAVTGVLNPSIRVGIPSSTICAMRTGSWLVNGSGTSTIGRSTQPNSSALHRASSTNPVDTNAAVGMPCCSSDAMSRISHDVQLPQSAVVPTTTSHSASMRVSWPSEM